MAGTIEEVDVALQSRLRLWEPLWPPSAGMMARYWKAVQYATLPLVALLFLPTLKITESDRLATTLGVVASLPLCYITMIVIMRGGPKGQDAHATDKRV